MPTKPLNTQPSGPEANSSLTLIPVPLLLTMCPLSTFSSSDLSAQIVPTIPSFLTEHVDSTVPMATTQQDKTSVLTVDQVTIGMVVNV